MAQIYSITQLELLRLTDGKYTWQGADQGWYQKAWRRRAGCGTTTAAHLLSYLSEVRPGLEDLYPIHSREKDEFLSFMNELWDYVTPGRMGLNTLNKFTGGITDYTRKKDVELSFCKLNISPIKEARPTANQCAAFLRAAMEAGSPVAFLNLSSGAVKGLDSWHWVTIIAVEEQHSGSIVCTALDGGGHELTMDFQLWLMTSRLGGGLVYVPPGRQDI